MGIYEKTTVNVILNGEILNAASFGNKTSTLSASIQQYTGSPSFLPHEDVLEHPELAKPSRAV